MKLPYVKIGTMPYGAAVVKSKRKMPKVGDIIDIRPDNGDKNIYSNPWKTVQIDEINDDCVFVHGVEKY
jgi:hypothetical protein